MTEWWQTEDMFGHLYEVLGHIKHARTSSTRKSTVICGVLFEALNRTWTAFNDLQKEPARADTPSLTKLIEGIPMYRKEEFLDSKELQSLVEFEPHVMNHDTLRRGGYRPGKKIEPHLMSKATEEHRQLVNAYKTYKESPPSVTQERLLKKTAPFLYMVRSNIAHGGKTPYGPDLIQMGRDEKVSSVVIPALHLLIELIYNNPDQKLVVYGTLAPRSPNESILAGIEGSWQECKIRGQIVDHEGLKYFKWDPNADEMDAKMLQSEALPDKWLDVDRFEGNYNRILIPAKVGDRYIVSNIYEGAEREN